MDFKLIFYETIDGKKPVENFLDNLDPKMKAKMLQSLRLLQKYGYELREPYTKNLVENIFELRCKQSKNIVRALFFFYIGKKIIITNGFIKKTNKTPKKEILLAQTRRVEYINRKE